jgi:hypothetical protein
MRLINSCRFCKKSQYDAGVVDSCMVKYGVRHWAHLRCLADQPGDRLRLELARMSAWQRGQLPALELVDLGVLDYVRQLDAQVCARCRMPIENMRGVVTADDGALFHGRCWRNA